MKKLVREFEFSPEQLHIVSSLARAAGISEVTAGILYARGIDTAEKMRVFLHPSEQNYLSPMLMQGMREAVELLTRAREEEWRVAVFGDYDADGIGACAVLSRALKRFGIEPYLFVPERSDGYGLSVTAIDRIFDDFLPDLIVTVDCGISCKEEVEYIKEQGAFVIVTDHHELPEELPDCIVINPKLKDGYPYDNLCGAGVAFKLAQALIGKEAYDLVDFAALSTVADSVPLLGENRDIVAEGLRRIENSPRPAFAALLGKAGEVTAQTLAFTLAPRINAAGRMGDARAALTLFTSEDESEIFDLAARLNAYNMERQRSCDELYNQVLEGIVHDGPYGNVVMLAGEGWNAGFIGIVAARIAEEFSRPALLFVRRGDVLKGSARSIERVNIFDALKNCSEHISEFGGHAQAAGINVPEDQFELLKSSLNAYIGEKYSREDFVPVVYIAGECSGDFRQIARELTLLEPCGMGNRKPLFTIAAGRVDAAPLKPQSPHIAMKIGGMDYVYFGGIKDLAVLKSDLKKNIVFEYNVSKFKGKEYVKGFVRTVVYDGRSGSDVEIDAFENLLRLLPAPRPSSVELLTTEGMNAFLKERIDACAYGLCAVVHDRRTLDKFPALDGLDIDLYRPASRGAGNCVILSPAPDADLSPFREIAVLDGPVALPETGRARILSNIELSDMGAIKHVSCVREDLLTVFSALRRFEGVETGMGYAEAARSLGLPFDVFEVVFALAVFEELGLISLADGRLTIFRGVKTELTQSPIYAAVLKMQEEG